MPTTPEREELRDQIMELPAVIDMDLHDRHALCKRLRDQPIVELDRIYAKLTTQT